MRRVASIVLPHLAIERWRKANSAQRRSANHPPDGPFAPLDRPTILVVEAAHGQLIHAVTAAAAERGARPGMRLTDARTLDPKLLAEPADSAGDAALLQLLARWAGRWSPLVEIDPSAALGAGGADGLRLDVSGVAHLFGGEAALAGDMEARFASLGLTARVAIAPTAGAAWALARYLPSPLEGEGRLAEGERGEGSPASQPLTLPALRASLPLPQGERELLAALSPLPVAALRLDARSAQILERLGLKTIGQLAGVPRKNLQRRFREAENPLDALDRALGRRDEPLTGEREEPAPRALIRLAEPVTHPEAGGQALDRLVPELARQLEARRLGARRLHLAGYRVDGSVAGTGVATAIPSREPKHLHRLLLDKAGSLDPEFGFDAFALTASWCEPLGAAQTSLVEEPSGEAEVARLVDRLSVKLGPERVRRPAPIASHVPERANKWAFAVSSLRGAQATKQSSGSKLDCFASLAMTGIRPHHLFDRPEAIAVVYATPEGVPRRFVWRRLVHDIARVEGPERIAPEWWRERSSARLRDYYRVEDVAGRRYWIFREGVIGDGRGGAPNWFLHGLFG